MLKIFVILFFIAVSNQALAHEGHDHGPGMVQPPKGGVIRSLETMNLELLTKGNTISIYIYDTALKPLDVSKYRGTTAAATLPKKKPQGLTLVTKGDHWEAEFDAKGAHRYALELTIKQGGHTDKVKFTVEPKK